MAGPRTRSPRWVHWCLAAGGCWAVAGAAELVGQWRLLSPPFRPFFGHPVVALVVGAYALCGAFLGLGLSAVRWGFARWLGLLAPAAVVSVSGLLFPAGGLTTPAGGLVALGVLLACAVVAVPLRGALPSPVLGFPMAALAVPFLLSAHSPLSPSRRVPAPQPRPNLLLVTLDTLRPDHLGLAGYGRPTSPGLDSLARAGCVFSQAYAPAPSTSPSHASILTGLSVTNHGVRRNGWPLGGAPQTLAEILSSHGYATGAVVSVAHLAAGFGWARGFSSFSNQGRLDVLFPYSGARLVRGVLRLVPVSFSCRAEASVARALAWLEGEREPFFLWLHLWDPHDPYEPPAPYDRLFSGTVAPPVGSRHDTAQITRWVNGYDGEIRYVDDQLQRLWAFLRSRGLEDRSIVIVVSDHGESLGERSYQGHSILLYDEQVRVLCLLVGPGITQGVIDTPVSLVDITPTALHLCGIPLPEGLDGRVLVGSDLPVLPVGFDVDMWGFVGAGVRVGPWKFMQYAHTNPRHRGFAPGAPAPGASCPELYELSTDPLEARNLASTHPHLVERLESLLGVPTPTRVPSMPPAVREALHSLGYVE